MHAINKVFAPSLSAAAMVALLAGPASAITDDTQDAATLSGIPGDALVQIVVRSENAAGVARPDEFCSGVMVAPRIVLTNAACFDNDNIPGLDILTDVNVSFAINGPTTGIAQNPDNSFQVEIFRYYAIPGQAPSEMAVFRLEADPGVTPVTLNTNALTTADEGLEVRIIGFGADETESVDTFAKRSITVELRNLVSHHFFAGVQNPPTSTCQGDRGAPVYGDPDNTGSLTLLAITGRQTQQCLHNTQRIRVDRFAEDFIFKFIDRFDSNCPLDGTCDGGVVCDRSPDPDCACEWGGGECSTGCATRDFDCELGTFAGDACENDEDCENGGSCVDAPDDPTHKYCDRPCDNGVLEISCPADMTCTANRCIFTDISRGSTGATCDEASECRSGLCEGSVCSTTCTSTAECPNMLECLPSTDGSAMVCRERAVEGGGGFCTVSGDSSSGLGGLIFLGLIGAAFVGRRRRRS